MVLFRRASRFLAASLVDDLCCCMGLLLANKQASRVLVTLDFALEFALVSLDFAWMLLICRLGLRLPNLPRFLYFLAFAVR